MRDDLHIDYRVIANGEDVTRLLSDRLVILTIVDEAGTKSDTLEITIDDRGYRVELPETGAVLEVELGFRQRGRMSMGRFVVDEVTGSGPPDQMVIKAKAADMRSAIKSPKTRAWKQKSLPQIVAQIAVEHGLEPAVSPALNGAFYGYLAQTSESDLHFLTRLARDLDARVKPASGHLVVVKAGEGTDTTGAALPVPQIGRGDLVSWDWEVTGRGRFESATAEWSEPGTATVHKVTAGAGDLAQKLRHRYPSEAEATRAAEAAVARSKRASGTLDLALAGFHGALSAEMKINVQGIKPELCGEWTITRVDHTLSDTLTTRLAAERDNEKGKS